MSQSGLFIVCDIFGSVTIFCVICGGLGLIVTCVPVTLHPVCHVLSKRSFECLAKKSQLSKNIWEKKKESRKSCSLLAKISFCVNLLKSGFILIISYFDHIGILCKEHSAPRNEMTMATGGSSQFSPFLHISRLAFKLEFLSFSQLGYSLSVSSFFFSSS